VADDRSRRRPGPMGHHRPAVCADRWRSGLNPLGDRARAGPVDRRGVRGADRLSIEASGACRLSTRHQSPVRSGPSGGYQLERPSTKTWPKVFTKLTRRGLSDLALRRPRRVMNDSGQDSSGQLVITIMSGSSQGIRAWPPSVTPICPKKCNPEIEGFSSIPQTAASVQSLGVMHDGVDRRPPTSPSGHPAQSFASGEA
jgi:hypothetical protein